MSDLIWLGHKNHYILSDRCNYALATYLPDQKILVSTVGELIPSNRHDPLKWEPLYSGEELYQTMVFRCTGELIPCGCPVKDSAIAIEEYRYDTAQEANAGHLEMVQKYLGQPSDNPNSETSTPTRSDIEEPRFKCPPFPDCGYCEEHRCKFFVWIPSDRKRGNIKKAGHYCTKNSKHSPIRLEDVQ